MSEQKSIAERVESATHELLKSPDWGANMAIVDSINGTEPGIGEKVMKALRSRLNHKNVIVGNLALSLLGTLVSNCPSFHAYVANPDFMKDLVKTLPKKNKRPSVKVIIPNGFKH